MSVSRPSLPRPSEGVKTGRQDVGKPQMMWLAYVVLAFVIGMAVGYAVRLA
jgi:hypothetical protein